jgi:hypothetical protein
MLVLGPVCGVFVGAFVAGLLVLVFDDDFPVLAGEAVICAVIDLPPLV